jgi:hypothetical protein
MFSRVSLIEERKCIDEWASKLIAKPNKTDCPEIAEISLMNKGFKPSLANLLKVYHFRSGSLSEYVLKVHRFISRMNAGKAIEEMLRRESGITLNIGMKEIGSTVDKLVYRSKNLTDLFRCTTDEDSFNKIVKKIDGVVDENKIGLITLQTCLKVSLANGDGRQYFIPLEIQSLKVNQERASPMAHLLYQFERLEFCEDNIDYFKHSRSYRDKNLSLTFRDLFY